MNEIEKHQIFYNSVQEYIRDCLKSNVTRKQILKSFEKFIDEELK